MDTNTGDNMDLFEKKEISPMLIAEEKPPFDSEDYIYELKLDGIRCIAYLDDSTLLMNKRSLSLNQRFPELTQIHRAVKGKCILDGELYVFHNGRPDFFRVQKRTVTRNAFKVKLLAQNDPAVYTAFDILYLDGKNCEKLPLTQRKRLLQSIVKENQQITVSRTIEREGIALFELTKEKNLEGIVAKRKDSIYVQGKRSKDWIKCKHMLEDDFVILGFRFLPDKTTSFLLGKFDDDDKLQQVASVSLGVSYKKIKDRCVILERCPNGTMMIVPDLVCTVKFMGYTEDGQMRQPSLKCLRDDKMPEECRI